MTVHALSHLAHFLREFKVLVAISPFAVNANWHQPNDTRTSGFSPSTRSACSRYEAARQGVPCDNNCTPASSRWPDDGSSFDAAANNLAAPALPKLLKAEQSA
jgi:hypothetical protein